MKLPDCEHKFIEPSAPLINQNPECELDVKIPENYDPAKNYNGRKCKWLLSRGKCPKGLKPN